MKSTLLEPVLRFSNKIALSENFVIMDASDRFLFQCTFDFLWIYDLLWNVRRKIELPESRPWLPFVMLTAHNRVLLAYYEHYVCSYVFLVECELDYKLLTARVLYKIRVDIQNKFMFHRIAVSDLLQPLSNTQVGVFKSFNKQDRKLLIIDTQNSLNRHVLEVPIDIRFVRFGRLIDRTLYFFGDSMQELWHFKRIYAMNIDSAIIAQLSLSSLFADEEMVKSCNVTDGAWNQNQQFSLTLNVRFINDKHKRLLFLLDLPSCRWRQVVFEDAIMSSTSDIKHRIDTNGSITLVVNQTQKLSHQTLVYRIHLRQPLKLSNLAFAVALRAHTKLPELDDEQLQRIGFPRKFYPLFTPDVQSALSSLFYWLTAIISVVGLGYYLVQILYAMSLSLEHDLQSI